MLPAPKPVPWPKALEDDLAAREALSAAPDAIAAAIVHALHWSPFLRALATREPERLVRCCTLGPDAMAAAAIEAARPDTSMAATMRILRQTRQDLAFACAIADIAGLWPLERVCGALSDYADAAIEGALQAAVQDVCDSPDTSGFVVLALGKLGARALNYSSDVDLILLFEPYAPALAESSDPHRKAERVAQRFVSALQGMTADGYCQRVDLRLRPDPGSTPIILPLSAAESYYQSAALPWERAAFIKARAVAGDIPAGRAFLKGLEPFVWRRSLDYTVVRDIHDMSLMVREHFDQETPAGSGFDVKRGQGGIRDVEFFVQIHQMIFGGREPAYRAAHTLDALQALTAGGKIPQDDARVLEAGYRFLRAVEHRLQMLDDAQTQVLPRRADERKIFARFAGYPDWKRFEAALELHTHAIAVRYGALTASTSTRERFPRAAEPELKARGFKRPADCAAAIERWRKGETRATRTARAQESVEAVLPQLVEAFAVADDRDRALLSFDSFLSGLPAGVQLFALLEHSPALLAFLVRILSVADAVAQTLVRTPDLLDVVLDPAFRAPLPPVEDLRAMLAARCARAQDFEVILDETRRFVSEQRFQLAVQLLDGAADAPTIQRQASDVADAALQHLTQACEALFAERHGRVPGGRLAVVALGRYGGQALSLSSDLDIIFLFSGAFDKESAGGQTPLAATTYFNRLSQRVIAALTAPTAAGELYAVDTRLRPSGAQGLLAVSIDSFRAYQQEQAWVWEHLALVRARVVQGAPEDAAAIEAAIREALGRPRDRDALCAAALDIRGEMDKHLPPTSSWDVKRLSGGLIDLEYAVQSLVLLHAHAQPALLRPDLPGMIAALGDAGLLPGSRDILQALTTLETVQTVVRVGFAKPPRTAAIPPAFAAVLASALKCPDLKAVEAQILDARGIVAQIWEQVFGTPRKPVNAR